MRNEKELIRQLTLFYNALDFLVQRSHVADDVKITRILNNVLYTDFYWRIDFGGLVPPTGEDKAIQSD